MSKKTDYNNTYLIFCIGTFAQSEIIWKRFNL